MHPYLSHLLTDIKNAEQKKNGNKEQKLLISFEEEMEEVERYVKGDDERPLSYFTGLKKEHFPPVEQLAEDDIKQVLDAFGRMLSTWNINIVYPDKMPTTDRYRFLINTVLEDEVVMVSSGSGFVCLDYCTGNSDECAWGEYCPCLDMGF